MTPPAGDDVDLLDLACPSCGRDLASDHRFLDYRVCGACGRHFAIGPRERIALLVDSGVFQELDPPLDAAAAEYASLPAAERLAEHHYLQVIGDAVVTGYGSVSGSYVVIVALDDHLVSHSLGARLADKVIQAFEYARREKLPVIVLAAGGALAVPAGPLSLAQDTRLATAAAQLHLDGIPVVGILSQPTSTGVFSTLAAHCDVLLGEPNVVLHGGGPGLDARGGDVGAASLLADGWIDGIVERQRLPEEIGRFIDVVTSVGMARPGGGATGGLLTIGETRGSGDSGLEACIRALIPNAFLFRGDRVRGDHPGAICGVGRLDSISVAFVGMSHATPDIGAGEAAIAARKIARLARFAGRLELPLVILVDGGRMRTRIPFSMELAYAGTALASTLSMLPVPVVSLGMGMIAGELATLLMNADRQYLTTTAVVAPPPEASASRQPGRPFGSPGEPDVIGASDCLRLGLIDAVVPEPLDSTGSSPEALAPVIRSVLVQALAELAGTGQRRLLDTRILRQRTLGQSTPDGLAEARSELWALQEWQRGVERNVERSIEEWRGRWEHLKASQPRLTFQRPDIGDLAARVRARRADLLERAGRGDRSTHE